MDDELKRAQAEIRELRRELGAVAKTVVHLHIFQKRDAEFLSLSVVEEAIKLSVRRYPDDI